METLHGTKTTSLNFDAHTGECCQQGKDRSEAMGFATYDISAESVYSRSKRFTTMLSVSFSRQSLNPLGVV